MVRFHSDLSPERLRARLTALSGPNPVPEGQFQVCLWRNDHFRLTFHMEPSKGKDALFEGKFRSDSRGGTQIYGRFGGSRLVAAACAFAFAPIGLLILIDKLTFRWGPFYFSPDLPGGENIPFFPGLILLWAVGAAVLFVFLYLMLCRQRREDNAHLRAFLKRLCEEKAEIFEEKSV